MNIFREGCCQVVTYGNGGRVVGWSQRIRRHQLWHRGIDLLVGEGRDFGEDGGDVVPGCILKIVCGEAQAVLFHFDAIEIRQTGGKPTGGEGEGGRGTSVAGCRGRHFRVDGAIGDEQGDRGIGTVGKGHGFAEGQLHVHFFADVDHFGGGWVGRTGNGRSNIVYQPDLCGGNIQGIPCLKSGNRGTTVSHSAKCCQGVAGGGTGNINLRQIERRA